MHKRRTRNRTLRSYAVATAGNFTAVQYFDARRLRVMMVGGVALLAIIIFYVWQHVQVVKMGYLISKLQSDVQTLDNERKLLEIRKIELQSLPVVQQKATALGLVIPKSESVVELEVPAGTAPAKGGQSRATVFTSFLTSLGLYHGS